MSIDTPPRLRRRRKRGGANVTALREQALIEEARRRTRQRRLGNLAVVALGLAIAMQVGFGAPGGRRAGSSDNDRPRLLSAPVDENGKIAIVDSSGSLAVIDPDGSGLRTLLRCRGIASASARTRNWLPSSCRTAEPAWSPDGRRLAFVRGQYSIHHIRGQYSIHQSAMALYVTDQNATRPRLLVRCGTCGRQYAYEGGISWSPDGTQIVFSASGSVPAVLSLYVVDTQGDVVRRLTNCDSGFCADAEPDWSPDGQLIVFSRFTRAGSSLYTVRPDGSGLTKVKSEADAMDPRWSPDGQLIAYDGRDSSHDIVYVVAADGSQPSRLLASGSRGTGPNVPSWSPDGSRIVYFSTPPVAGAFGSEVWTVNVDGSARRRLARFGCCIETGAPPVWSPDGKQIAFSANYQELTVAADGSTSGRPSGGTFVVNADGSGRKRLTRRVAGAISWQRVH